MAITLTNSLLRDYVEYAGHSRPPDGVLHLLGIRSCRLYPTEDETIAISLVEPMPNHYDDLVGYFGNSLDLYPGTVDPGRYYSQNPLLPRLGCAHLVGLDEPEGKVYRYVQGTHRGRAAFRQDGPIVIWRDKDRDMAQDAGEPPRTTINNGVNIHRMGVIESDIKRWSAGCPGVMEQHWGYFWKGSAVMWPQAQYLFHLIDAHKFAHWFDHERKSE